MKFVLKNKAFTLVEIVVVIGIMGVLTAIIYSSFDASKAQSRDQKRVSDVSVIQIALEQYFQKNGVYPVNLTNPDPKLSLVPTFLPEIPRDPSTNVDYSVNYFPMTKTSGSDKCISYQLWTTFERSNSYLNSKRGFDSLPENLLPQKINGIYYKCGVTGNTNPGINASLPMPPYPYIYDVMP